MGEIMNFKVGGLMGPKMLFWRHRKVRKLLQNPKLFFFDALKNRLSDYELQKSLGAIAINTAPVAVIKSPPLVAKQKQVEVGKSEVKQEMIQQDWIHNQDNIFDELMTFLLLRTCFVQLLDSPNPDTIRLAVKSEDFNYIIKNIKEFSCNNIYIQFETEKYDIPQRALLKGYFRDEHKLYMSPTIEIDPWFISEKYKRVYSHNYNYLCTHVDINDLNKTVHASHPYFLQGSIKEKNHYHLKNMLDIAPSLYHDFNFDVDVVYTWVDGNDSRWLKKKNRHHGTHFGHIEDVDQARYEQIDELRYSLRSVASYFKGYRKIYIVTDGQTPWWLDTTHKDIVIVDHRDIFPNKSDLPVFNSHAIEANLHRIPGLSKKFIYLNDDVFFWRALGKDSFYMANGLSVSRFEGVSNVHGRPSPLFPGWRNAALNNNKLLRNKYNAGSYSYHLHCPHALDRDVCQQMWQTFKEALLKTSKSKFRSIEDVSPISFLYHAFSFKNGYSIRVDNTNAGIFNTANAEHMNQLERAVQQHNIDFICLNDGGVNRHTKKVLALLERKFPIPAEWEIVG